MIKNVRSLSNIQQRCDRPFLQQLLGTQTHHIILRMINGTFYNSLPVI
ncbi:hypothetical protein FDUTEX481_01277 [Tolypothrix sp. PCC 7601]|nr:hypothetical protein FDUTEX481_01277 [Tolypothrix sp. PCC 7601]